MRVQTRGFVSCDVCIDILGKKKNLTIGARPGGQCALERGTRFLENVSRTALPVSSRSCPSRCPRLYHPASQAPSIWRPSTHPRSLEGHWPVRDCSEPPPRGQSKHILMCSYVLPSGPGDDQRGVAVQCERTVWHIIAHFLRHYQLRTLVLHL